MSTIIKPRRRSGSPIINLADSFAIKWTDIYQDDDVIFPKVKAGGIAGCIMRAHFGTAPDTKHAAYVASSRAEGLGIGSYGFILPNQNINEQVAIAVAMVKAIGGYKPGDVRFWMDVEGKAWQKVKAATSRAQLNRIHREWRKAQAGLWHAAAPTDNKRMDILLAYLNGIKDALGVMPGIYASAHFLTAIFPDPAILLQLKDLLYWVAHYVDAPDVQEPFKSNNPQWDLWQSAENAVISGINGDGKKADLNFFYGTQTDFNRLFG